MTVDPAWSYSPLPDTGKMRKALALFAWNLPGLLLVVCAVSSGKLEPRIVADLPTSHPDWFSLTFVLATLLGCPAAIRIGELYGKRRAVEVVCAVGVAGQLVTLAAPGFGVALAGHALAGLYVAVGPVSLFALGDCFPGRRNFVLCVLAVIVMSAATAALTTAVTPALLDAVGWRGMSALLAGLIAVAALLLRTVPRHPATGVRFAEVGLAARLLDGAGPALLVTGLVMGTKWKWGSAFVLTALGVGAGLVALLVLRGVRGKAAAVAV
ncbi:hypothetical protein [Streptomyces sp. NPDC057340]|uniref:hypothetical protein n=1 Tax=Streptomyces sp. NPDC057340 TaxID=3346103 RepID=UPI0036319C6F